MMIVKAGFQALTLGAALVVASLGAGAMAQEEPAEQRTSQVPSDEQASQAPADQPAGQEPSGSASSTAKADLDQAAIRGAAVDQTPRTTLTSTTAAVPKILGSYR